MVDFVEGSILDQIPGESLGQHHVVTGVDTGRAINTLQLGTIADVDTCRADGDTLGAVYTMAGLRITLF